MPELTVVHFGLLALMLVVGIIGGWILRTDRCAKEKIAVSASWQDQLESQQSEHNRLAEQNKSLMEQISQYQASQKDYSNRAKELSDSLKEAFARRDALQRQIKDLRGNLEVAVAQRDRLKTNLQSQNVQGRPSALKEKDDKIFRLSRELTTWQSRVPPLVERFQERDKQARELEEELDLVQTRLRKLEELVKSDQTRIEPLDAESLPDGGDASNEPIAMTSGHDTSVIQDQSDDDGDDEYVDEVGPADDAEDSATEEESAFAAVFSDEETDADEAGDDEVVEDDDPDDDPDDDEADEADEADGADEEDADTDEIDDLKSIKGIGPSIEKTLNELGIHRFHQIAEMSEFDIDRIAQQLRGFRSRVYREDWIGQARDLQNQKNGSPS
jgi:predicted flap endonuclease-1-like 5' DNA nuclease